MCDLPVIQCVTGGGVVWAVNLEIPRSVRTRKEIHELTSAELQSLRNGIAAMKARPVTDKRSWRYQANLNGVPIGEEDVCSESATMEPLWGTGEYHSFYFLLWHRLHLFYFEQILREASGDPNLTLPFWDWENPMNRLIPEPFRVPANTENPLWDGQRIPDLNNGTQGLTQGAVDASGALALTVFSAVPAVLDPLQTFGGEAIDPNQFPLFGDGNLEFGPHSFVRDEIGGLLISNGCAARDPLFYIHMANLDRLWEAWLDQGEGRANPLDDPNWTNIEFTFINGDGQEVVITGREAFDTIFQLDYQYAPGTHDQDDGNIGVTN